MFIDGMMKLHLSAHNHFQSKKIKYLGILRDLNFNLSKEFKIYLCFVIVSLIFFIYVYFNYLPIEFKQTPINNALYVVSSLIQSEAAVLGIVVTLSLVAVQLTSSSYSTKVISIFRSSPSFWILFSIYIIAIICSLGILKFLTEIPNNLSNHEFAIWLSYLLGVYAFLALVPYILDILNLMKPSTVIKKLSEKITKSNIKFFLNKKENDQKDDPIQPVMDILFGALLRYDYGTIRECLIVLRSKLSIIFEDFEEKDEEEILIHIFDHLFRLAQLTERIIKDLPSIEELILILEENGNKTSNKKIEKITLKAIKSIETIGIVAADQEIESVTQKTIESLEKIGITSAKNKLKKATPQTIHSLESIGKIVAEKRLNKSTTKVLVSIENVGLWAIKENLKKTARQGVYSLETVGNIAAKNKAEQKRYQAIDSIENLGLKSAEKKFNDTTRKSIKSLRNMGKIAIKKKSRKTTLKIIQSITKIGKITNKNRLEYPTQATIRSLAILGKMAAEERLKNITLHALESIKTILESDQQKIDISDDIIQTINSINFNENGSNEILEKIDSLKK